MCSFLEQKRILCHKLKKYGEIYDFFQKTRIVTSKDGIKVRNFEEYMGTIFVLKKYVLKNVPTCVAVNSPKHAKVSKQKLKRAKKYD